jgi:hypothetical protein
MEPPQNIASNNHILQALQEWIYTQGSQLKSTAPRLLDNLLAEYFTSKFMDVDHTKNAPRAEPIEEEDKYNDGVDGDITSVREEFQQLPAVYYISRKDAVKRVSLQEERGHIPALSEMECIPIKIRAKNRILEERFWWSDLGETLPPQDDLFRLCSSCVQDMIKHHDLPGLTLKDVDGTH